MHEHVKQIGRQKHKQQNSSTQQASRQATASDDLVRSVESMGRKLVGGVNLAWIQLIALARV